MSFHETLTPLHKRQPLQWPGLPELGSGGFASVRELGPTEVLKLTCCPASNRWFAKARAGKAGWPSAFPKVLQSLGPLAVDQDGFVFRGWRVERLFDLADKHGAIRARSASIKSRMASDPSAASRGVAPETEALDALMSVIDFCDVAPEDHWTVDATAALLLASACDGELRQGFLSLRQFVLKNKVKLDVGNRRNIMMDCFGRLRLADPLTMRLDDVEATPPANRVWLTARLPVSQRGFDVTTRCVAVPFAQGTSAQAALARYAALGPALQVKLTDEASAAAQVAQPDASVRAHLFGANLAVLREPQMLTDLLSLAELR